MKVKDISSNEWQAEVLDSTLPVLVDFWAPWCGPCRMMAPILDELAELSVGKFVVLKLNVENQENIALAQDYNIRSIPNMKLFKDGKVIHEYVGLVDAKSLLNSIIRVI